MVGQIRRPLFVRINAGTVFLTRFKCLETSWLHQAKFDKFFGTCDVHRAPDAACPTRCEPDHVAGFINTLSDAVNPAKAECFVD